MKDTEALARSATLLDRMAGAVGVDLEEAILTAGTLTIDELTDAVLRCTDCSDPGHCAGWLAARSEPAERTPGYCRNREMMARLQSATV